MSNRKVPELSLLSYLNGTTNDQVTFVNTLFNGLKDYGFVILTEHTVAQEKVDKAYEYVHEFFQLPEDIKNKYYDEKIFGQRGLTPFGREHAKGNPNPDLKEFWHVGRELSSGSQYHGVYPDNIWPAEIVEFKKAFMELYTAMDASSVVLLEAIGKSLDVPEGFFRDMVSDGNSILRTIHYPPTTNHDTKNSIRAAAHDHSTCGSYFFRLTAKRSRWYLA
jgi:isopenicillin N synthase-like dioxygenase